MSDFKVGSVARNTLSRQVLEKFIELLMDGSLKTEDKLPSEMELMHMFDVSRPVLREALSSLETLEIITRRPRGGTFINKKIGSNPFRAMLALSINNVPAVIEARMSLELGLVTLAAEKITEEQLASLEETITAIENTEDGDYGAIDREFHRIIADSANNPVVSGMIDSLLIAHQKTDSLIVIRERDITVEHHRAIYEALKSKDPVESFKQMYRHLQYVRKKILANYNE
ncbi:FadR/GntR family transcriptional regulator [Salinicoccus hispanicus]|uniref:FCD domain-containing protein n=2 Tax=Salinicoccus hispanicus TaxID=157225 RepID=A0A6N8TYQ8_9STAP|nr:FadR/GntR family transcriptional regulator [Salinicoccus hispanicus]MXQ50984.1 FCD domain-containing protein [Salinicoccus hispanicus]